MKLNVLNTVIIYLTVMLCISSTCHAGNGCEEPVGTRPTACHKWNTDDCVWQPPQERPDLCHEFNTNTCEWELKGPEQNSLRLTPLLTIKKVPLSNENINYIMEREAIQDNVTVGLTPAQDLSVKIRAFCSDNKWHAVLDEVIGEYSLNVFTNSFTEVTGIGVVGNTTEENYCSQVSYLLPKSRLVGVRLDITHPWGMEEGIRLHEEVHESRLLPALADAISFPGCNLLAGNNKSCEVAIEETTVDASDSMTEEDAIAQLSLKITKSKGFVKGLEDGWHSMYASTIPNDHAGPTDVAQEAIEAPMRRSICLYAAVLGWMDKGSSSYCAPCADDPN